MIDMNMIEILVQMELEEANKKFPPFNSLHEAYAVLLEEVEEADLEQKHIKLAMAWLWGMIKEDTEIPEDFFRVLKDYAKYLVAEAIQVAAMCQKAMDMNSEVTDD